LAFLLVVPLAFYFYSLMQCITRGYVLTVVASPIVLVVHIGSELAGGYALKKKAGQLNIDPETLEYSLDKRRLSLQ